MPGSVDSDNLTISSGGETWLILQQHLDAYRAERDRQGQPPSLRRFLPAEPATLRRLVLVELIKVDLDYRWRYRGEQRLLEQYFPDFPELADGRAPCDLIYEEYHIRKRLGQDVDPDDYFRRFPEQSPQLRALLGKAPTVTYAAQPVTDLAGLQPGMRLDEFELLARLGAGAFGTVFLARQVTMQRLVALKVSASRAAEPETLAQLDHPCIVRVYDQKQLNNSGLHLMYMQYVPGGTLQAVIAHLKGPAGKATPPEQRTGKLLLRVIDEQLEKRGETPPAESALRSRLAAMSWPEVVCEIGARLAEALDHAHSQGVLHRDVKPANVLLTAEGLPRLADFNVGCSSKVEGAGPSAFFGGSLAYMSPEQLDAFNPASSRPVESLDGRSDLYSLGVLLWELLTGKMPFADLPVSAGWATLLDRLLEQRNTGTPPALTDLPGLPPGLEKILLTCLSADPNQRYQTGRELAAQLDLCLKPRARELMNAPARGWQHLVRLYPAFSLLMVGLLVSGVMGVFNFVYNHREIINKGKLREEVFLRTQAVINGVVFPLGIALFLSMAWPLHRGLKRIRRGEKLSQDQLRPLRRLCLRQGMYGAGICLTCWLLAGFAYPIGMSIPLNDPVFFHWLASLAMCGLVAAAYPFFIGTFLAVRILYPVLLTPGSASPDDAADLRRVLGWLPWYLLVAACVPLLALTLLSVFQSSGNADLHGVLGVGGLVGFAGMSALAVGIRSDLEALTEVVQPGR